MLDWDYVVWFVSCYVSEIWNYIHLYTRKHILLRAYDDKFAVGPLKT
jgi:hypothetical protein